VDALLFGVTVKGYFIDNNYSRFNWDR